MTMPPIDNYDMTRTVNDVRRILAKIFDNLPTFSLGEPIPTAAELDANMIERSLAGLQPYPYATVSSITVAEANAELRALSLAQAFMLEIKTTPLLSTVVQAMAEDFYTCRDLDNQIRLVGSGNSGSAASSRLRSTASR